MATNLWGSLMTNILKELYDPGVYVGNLRLTDELIASFTKLETLIYSKEIDIYTNKSTGIKGLILKDNPFLKMVEKDNTNAFQGQYVPVPLKYK